MAASITINLLLKLTLKFISNAPDTHHLNPGLILKHFSTCAIKTSILLEL